MAQKRRSLFFIPLLVVFCALIGGMYGPRVQVASAASSDDDVKASLQQFTKVYSTVEQNFADPVSPDKAHLQRRHSGHAANARSALEFLRSQRRSKRCARISADIITASACRCSRRNGHTVVVAPFVGSPAYRAGLRPGDVIIEVNDKSTEGLDTTKVADMLKGPKGTPVQIKVTREGADQPIIFNIIRDEISRKSVPEAFMLKPGIGYIKIEQFNETTGREFEQGLKELDEDTLKGLVLDLRGNPGGLLNEAVSVADHLLPKGDVIVSHKGRASAEHVYTARNGNHGRNYPDRGSGEPQFRERRRDRFGRPAGSRSRVGSGRQHFRQRTGADRLSADGEHGPRADDGEVLHPERTADSARLLERIVFRLLLPQQHGGAK